MIFHIAGIRGDSCVRQTVAYPFHALWSNNRNYFQPGPMVFGITALVPNTENRYQEPRVSFFRIRWNIAGRRRPGPHFAPRSVELSPGIAGTFTLDR
jgi:hypothetical protein